MSDYDGIEDDAVEEEDRGELVDEAEEDEPQPWAKVSSGDAE